MSVVHSMAVCTSNHYWIVYRLARQSQAVYSSSWRLHPLNHPSLIERNPQMLTLDTPTDTEWATLTGLHRTRWFANPAANWTDVRRCEQCTNPAVAILDYLTTTLNGDGIAIDPDDHAITYCGLCLPDNLPALISELLWPPLAEETVVEIELDSAWLRLVDAPRTITDRLGTFALGCAA